MLCSHTAQTGKHLLRTQNVFDKTPKHFLCLGHKILVPRQMFGARANREIFAFATMCPRLPGPRRVCICLVPVWLSLRRLRSTRFGDAAEANGRNPCPERIDQEET